VSDKEFVLPWLPPGSTVHLPGRGEVFVRHHRHADPTRPTLLLLHGWTASADLQFVAAYQTLAEHCSFVAVDHRGHGRGLRTPQRFELEDVADDAAAVLGVLGIDSVIVVGYSMGGPLSLLLTRRHPTLVAGIVVEATALEWRSSLFERSRWKAVRLLGPMLRSWTYPRWLRFGIGHLIPADHPFAAYVPWLEVELRRGDPQAIVQAGFALSRYDARPWASQLCRPAASVITTQDRLVWPRKQRALADALGAQVIELHGDHLASWEHPTEFAAATLAAVTHVVDELARIVEPPAA
jgi:pimeloyl-ACP methyl ester carboxylesterase